jgi:hypothetical protein
VTTALLVRLEAKPGKEAEVEAFLRRDLGAAALAEEEHAAELEYGSLKSPA